MTATKRRRAIVKAVAIAVAAVVLVLAVLLAAGSWALYRFLVPVPDHFRDLPGLPLEAQSLIGGDFSEEASHVYYFATKQLRGAEYVRASLPEAAFDAYRDYLLVHRGGQISASLPDLPPKDMKRIQDWWPQIKTPTMMIVDVRAGFDFAILDTDTHIIWAVIQED